MEAMEKSVHTSEYRALRAELRKLRQNAGFSQRALAPRLSVPHSWVAKIENGERRIDLIEFCWFATACGGMLGKAKLSPTGRGLPDIAERISRLETYERWRTPIRVKFESIVPRESWDHYWSLCERVIEDMRRCQEVADKLRAQVVDSLPRT